jgi:hypothetical protein
MRYILLTLALCSIFFSCEPDNSQTDPDQGPVVFEEFPLEIPEEKALMARWEEKEVLKTKTIDDFETKGNWHVDGIGEMNYTDERSRDGKQSIRFRTSLRDEEYYRNNRSEWDSFNGRQGGRSFV